MSNVSRIRVKVCGVTLPGDAEWLDDRVDYLGFNFFPGSKRFIAPEIAATIIRRLRHAIPVGVFVDAMPEHIQAVAEQTGIRMLQLHGNEGWSDFGSLTLPIIKAIPHTRLSDLGGLLPDWNGAQPHPEFFLIDTQAGPAFGGSGQAFDWTLLARHPLPLPFFLAGGLGPENLLDATRTTQPYAVDLNSKVEKSPGIKDLARIETCLQQLTRAIA